MDPYPPLDPLEPRLVLRTPWLASRITHRRKRHRAWWWPSTRLLWCVALTIAWIDFSLIVNPFPNDYAGALYGAGAWCIVWGFWLLYPTLARWHRIAANAENRRTPRD